MRYHYTLLRMITIQKTDNKLLARMQSNKKFYSLVGLQNSTVTLEDSLVVSYKVKHSHTIWSSIALFSIYLTDLKTCVCIKICVYMFTVVLFIITKIWKQPRYSSIDEWINKLWYFHTMECYSVTKRNCYKAAKRHKWILNPCSLVAKTHQKGLHNDSKDMIFWKRLYCRDARKISGV